MLKAVILDIATGAVKRRFDWPTRGRGSLLRVTHSGDLLLKLDNLVQTLKPDGTPLASLKLTKVNPGDMSFIAESPAVNTIVVTLISSMPDGKTVNGMAILDTPSLKPLAQWHDEGDWWNLAASPGGVVRTVKGHAVQAQSLKDVTGGGGNWLDVWSGPGLAGPPLFLDDENFAFPAAGSVRLFNRAGKNLWTGGCESSAAAKIAVSRDGNALGAVCLQFPGYRFWGSDLRYIVGNWINVWRGPLNKGFGFDSVTLGPIQNLGFDLALSPAVLSLAIIDGLHLQVWGVRVGAPKKREDLNTAAVTAQVNNPVIDLSRDSAPQEPPVFRANSRLVLVDVTATDKQGRFLRDLKADDFNYP